jgi:PilZ domain
MRTPDRRHSERKLDSQEIMLSHGNRFKLCKIHDISLESVLLEVGWAELTRDTPVDLTMDLPADDGVMPFHLSGKVKQVTKHGTVIEIMDLDPDTLKALAKYIKDRG